MLEGVKYPVLEVVFLAFRSLPTYLTVQKVYFIPNISNIFLPLEGCKDLKLVSRNFPFTKVSDQVDDTTEEQEDPFQQNGGQPGIRKLISSVVNVEPDGQTTVPDTSTTIPEKNKLSSKPKEMPKEPKEVPEKDKKLPKPKEMPYLDTEENISKLEVWLRDTFKDVFDTSQSPLPAMSGKPLHIHVSDDAIPHVNYSPIPIPVHWKQAVKDILEIPVLTAAV